MITLDKGYIRMAEPDDARALWRLYYDGELRAGLLDSQCEPMLPTVDELREMMGRHEITQGNLFAIENVDGNVVGFCNLRGMTKAVGIGDCILMFHDPATFMGSLADDVLRFALERQFDQSQRKRVHAPCLQGETQWRDFLKRHGFESLGFQREVLYAQGRWHDLEALSLDSPHWQSHP